MKPKKILKIVFWSSLGIFIALVGYFTFLSFFSAYVERLLFLIAAVLGFIFLLLGIALIFLTIKQKIKGKLKIFLMLMGISAISVLIFSILHNVFYALGIIGENILVIKYVMEFLHVSSFIISLFVSPIVFLVGVIGCMVLFMKKGRKKK